MALRARANHAPGVTPGALSFWARHRHVGEHVYDVAGTPCEPLGAVSYMGIPLLDTDHTILGHLAVLDDGPLPEDSNKLAVFNIFVGRAAAERRRHS